MRQGVFAEDHHGVVGMKKGVLIALCVTVVAAAGGVWWWMGRGDVAESAAGPATTAPTAAEMAARAEKIQQGIARHRVLWREASYIEIRQAAMDGELVAQRRLSEVYEDCLVLEGRMRRSLTLLAQLGNVNPRFAPTAIAILRDKDRLCVQAKADLANMPEAPNYWLHKSAKAGDLVSEMRYFSRTVPKLSHNQYQYFIDKIRVSGDPDAIFELSLILSKLDGRWPDPTQASAFSGTTAEQAWVLAACRAGYDCARGSRLMNMLCLNRLSCAESDYQRHLGQFGSDPALMAVRQKQLALIEGSILTPKSK
jgi:hypothetical protein